MHNTEKQNRNLRTRPRPKNILSFHLKKPRFAKLRTSGRNTVGNYKILEKFCRMTNLALGPTYKKTTKNSEFSDACVNAFRALNGLCSSKQLSIVF